MTVLRNEYNQGYGGNQKVGYAYAIREGFDFVAHGARRRPVRARGAADAHGAAARGRGRRGLRQPHDDALRRAAGRHAALQVRRQPHPHLGRRTCCSGTALSEFHSGYRVYSVAALRAHPATVLNSNDFHFDTEIIIQLLNAGLRIVELPIPTYYGDEICRVNGMRYAKDVMLATLRNAAAPRRPPLPAALRPA